MAMTTYSVAQAKDQLPSLIDRALAGEEVVITRRGIVVAELKGRNSVSSVADDDIWERLRRLRESQTPVSVSAADLVRQMRDEGY
jgi:antitoxin (DNA-binding transcriptional repressor) of toxin-antitoxin stability system